MRGGEAGPSGRASPRAARKTSPQTTRLALPTVRTKPFFASQARADRSFIARRFTVLETLRRSLSDHGRSGADRAWRAPRTCAHTTRSRPATKRMRPSSSSHARASTTDSPSRTAAAGTSRTSAALAGRRRLSRGVTTKVSESPLADHRPGTLYIARWANRIVEPLLSQTQGRSIVCWFRVNRTNRVSDVRNPVMWLGLVWGPVVNAARGPDVAARGLAAASGRQSPDQRQPQPLRGGRRAPGVRVQGGSSSSTRSPPSAPATSGGRT